MYTSAKIWLWLLALLAQGPLKGPRKFFKSKSIFLQSGVVSAISQSVEKFAFFTNIFEIQIFFFVYISC